MHKIKVLVVEDIELWQDLIREELENCECEVDVVSNSEEAKKKLRYNTYDIVTLDMALKLEEERAAVRASSGWRLLVNQLAQEFPGTAIFVISASFGNEPKRAFELNRQYGVKDFMTKDEDFDPTILQKWVEQIRKFKEIGGRPNVTAAELLDIYQKQLAIQKKNKAHAELQKAKHGLDVPLALINTIEECEKEIKRIEIEITNLSN